MEASSVHRRPKPIATGSKGKKKRNGTKKSVQELMMETEVQHHAVEEVLSDAEEEDKSKYYSYEFNYNKSQLASKGSVSQPNQLAHAGDAEWEKESDLYSSNASNIHSKKCKNSPGQSAFDNYSVDNNSNAFPDDISQISFRSKVSEALSFSSRVIGSSRAVLIYNSTGDESAKPKELTMKELIEDVSKRIKAGRKKPHFVDELSELSNDKLYWNKKYPLLKKYKLKEKNRHISSLSDLNDDSSKMSDLSGSGFGSHMSKSRSSLGPTLLPSLKNNFERNSDLTRRSQQRRLIDIQGCMQPVELILAKATERIVKGSHAQLKHEIYKEEQRKQIISNIENKEKRVERYIAKIKETAVKKAWVSIIQVFAYLNFLLPKYKNKAVEVLKIMKHKSSSQILVRAILRWYRNLIYVKYRRKLLSKLKKDTLFNVRLRLRIFKKRRAVVKIIFFLKTMKEQKKVSFVVHRFVTSVKKIQRACHGFLACKKARLAAIQKIWDRLEPKFVAAVLNSRKSSNMSRKGGKLQNIPGMSVKEMIELEKQTKRWQEIDNKVASTIMKQALLGNMDTSSNDLVSKHLLGDQAKFRAIWSILIDKRKAHLLNKYTEYEQKVSKLSKFSEEDAYDLLQGRTTEIDKIVREKCELTSHAGPDAKTKDSAGRYIRPISTFFIYKHLDKQFMVKQIKEAHFKAGTFEIDTKSPKKK